MLEKLILKSNFHNNYGVCGKKAPFKDSNGDNLYTGDVVVLFRETGDNFGECVIVEDNDNGEIFISGIRIDCPDYEKYGWKIYKEKSYMSMKEGNKIDYISYEKYKKEVKKMTVSEICKKLGYEVEIIKED